MSYTQAAYKAPCSLQRIPAAHPWKQIFSSCVSMGRAPLWPCSFNHFDESSVFLHHLFYFPLGNLFISNICHLSTPWEQRLMSLRFPCINLQVNLCTSPPIFFQKSHLSFTSDHRTNLSYAPNAPCALLPQKCALRSVLQRRPWPQQIWSSSCLQAKWMWSILCLLI